MAANPNPIDTKAPIASIVHIWALLRRREA
jgi:hypothetical protein